jgi:tetratricopeptide (TPR) repeat protein
VPAISQESFELAYREIGIRLRIPGITNDNADIKQLVKEALSSDTVGDWLMIVDNADDPGIIMGSADGDPRPARLSDCLPRSKGGSVLFTTRNRKVAGDLTQNSVLGVDNMSVPEARQLLAQQITTKTSLDDEEAISELLGLLTNLPLAIVQAAAFINNNDISVSEYVSLFRQPSTEVELFSAHFEDHNRYGEMESTIAKTWHISFDQIRRQDRLAADYLSFIACIDRINIPLSLLPIGGSLVEQTKALGTLKGYAFITERQQAQQLKSEKLFDMHRLVHMASVWWLDSHNEQKAWTAKAAARLEELIPYGDHERRDLWTMYLSHAIHIAELDGVIDERTRTSLLNRVGRCQATLGQYTSAEATHRKELLLRERWFAKEDRWTLVCMNDLGVALENQGKFEAAESMHRQTLAMREEMFGKEHPSTLLSMNNLAAVLDEQGKHEVAEPMHRQTLAMREKVLGKEHPDTLTTMNNLALGLDEQGKYEAAETMHRQTLAMRKKVLGKEHPVALVSMNNLATVLKEQGKHEAAETMHKQTLAMREKVLGKEHPDTLQSMSNLAAVLDARGKYETAETIQRKTLVMREKVLGKEHPDTLLSVYYLAYILGKQRRYDEAAALYDRACNGYSTVLGSDHPKTLASRRHYSHMQTRRKQDLS